TGGERERTLTTILSEAEPQDRPDVSVTVNFTAMSPVFRKRCRTRSPDSTVPSPICQTWVRAWPSGSCDAELSSNAASLAPPANASRKGPASAIGGELTTTLVVLVVAAQLEPVSSV